MHNLTGRLARILAALTLVSGVGVASTPATARGNPEHFIRYVVTADGGQEVSIHYRVAPPSETSSGARYEQVFISPENSWEQTAMLADPYQYGYVSVRNIWWNPKFRCEVWVDGELAIDGTGVCVLTDRCRLAPCVSPAAPASSSVAGRRADSLVWPRVG